MNPGVVINFVECSSIKNCQIDDSKKSISKSVERQPLEKPRIIENLNDRILPVIRYSNRFDDLEVDELDNEENIAKCEDTKYIKKNNPKRKAKKKRKVKTKHRKKVDDRVQLKSERNEDTNPEILRCKSCQKSHFPFKKFCRWSISRNRETHTTTSSESCCIDLDESTIKLLHRTIIFLESNSSIKLRGGIHDGAESSLINKAI